MRTSVIIFFCFCLLTVSCKKEEPVTNTYIKYYHGILYDSLTGNVIPGKTINFLVFRNGEFHFNEQLITNQNGEFSSSFSLYDIKKSKGSMPSDYRGWVCTSFDTIAGVQFFNNHYFTTNDSLELDIYAKPHGYLAITLIDTSLSPGYTVYLWNSVVDNFLYVWDYNAEQNAFADTTTYFKIYGNTNVLFGMGDNATIGPFVHSRDTTKMTIYY